MTGQLERERLGGKSRREVCAPVLAIGFSAITAADLEAGFIEVLNLPRNINEKIDMSNESFGATPDSRAEQLAACEAILEYKFNDEDLLVAALTHASGANHRLASNERMEFLGDAILGLVVCELLFRTYPEYLEGDLTKVKSVVVSRQTCARISERLALAQFLIVGKGMATAAKYPQSLLADVFESLVAAIYLDGGETDARDFIIRHIEAEVEAAVAGEVGGNYKSQLQQHAQREFGATPIYQLLDEKGPDHSKCFLISAQVGGKKYQSAWGRNKKEAEQRAACNALLEMNGEEAKFDIEQI